MICIMMDVFSCSELYCCKPLDWIEFNANSLFRQIQWMIRRFNHSIHDGVHCAGDDRTCDIPPACKIRPMHDCSLQGNAIMEMLSKSSLVRCHDLIRMQRNVFFRLFDELRAKKIGTSACTNKSQFFANGRRQLLEFLHSICFSTFSGDVVSYHFHTILQALAACKRDD